jgi:hypothetical protein
LASSHKVDEAKASLIMTGKLQVQLAVPVAGMNSRPDWKKKRDAKNVNQGLGLVHCIPEPPRTTKKVRSVTCNSNQNWQAPSPIGAPYGRSNLLPPTEISDLSDSSFVHHESVQGQITSHPLDKNDWGDEVNQIKPLPNYALSTTLNQENQRLKAKLAHGVERALAQRTPPPSAKEVSTWEIDVDISGADWP